MWWVISWWQPDWQEEVNVYVPARASGILAALVEWS